MPQVVVRFSEYEYYDITQDEQWVRFMGTTNDGTFYAERPFGTSKVFRENRQRFRQEVMECLGSSIRPKEIEWN